MVVVSGGFSFRLTAQYNLFPRSTSLVTLVGPIYLPDKPLKEPSYCIGTAYCLI